MKVGGDSLRGFGVGVFGCGFAPIDNSVLRIETIYDDVGRVEKVTSYADTAGYTPLNQVEYVYNGWGNVYREYQEHSGTVDLNTPFVQYDYADGGSAGVAKYVHLDKVTYPDGREVNYDYGTAGAIDDIMSRLASIKDDDGSTVLASYKYLGANRIVTEDYEEIEVNLDYTGTNNDFSKLDRFGRVADQVWNDYGATPDVVLDRYTYTYDRVGNRTSRDNELHAAFDEDYTYDALYRLTGVDRADAFDQSWDLDGLGNWGTFDDDGTSQTRTANEANEITAITGGWITPAYDAAGNMISGPKPGDETTRVHYIYDAWNRLTEVRADDSGDPGNPGDLIATYSYDGLNRRIEKEVAAGSVDTHYFYNTSWQCLEERVEVSAQLPAGVHYVWGAKYVDDLILRDRDTDANGTMDERLYALTDANYNVTALVNAATGAVVERFLYDAYGTVTELDPDFTPYTGTDYDWEYTYTTRRLDEETGLMYYRNRMYHTELGVFVSRDPIGYGAGDANPYAYCGNSSVSNTDPFGLTKTRTTTTYTSVGNNKTIEYAANELGAREYLESYVRQIREAIRDLNERPDEVGTADCPPGEVKTGEKVVSRKTKSETVYETTKMWVVQYVNPKTGRLTQGPFVADELPEGLYPVGEPKEITLKLTKTVTVETIEATCKRSWKCPKWLKLPKLW